jgi:hypothetical protein
MMIMIMVMMTMMMMMIKAKLSCLEGIKICEVTVSLILNIGIRLGVSGQLHVPVALPRVQVISAPTE